MVLPQSTVGGPPVSHSHGVVWDSIWDQEFYRQESSPTMKRLNGPNLACILSKDGATRALIRYGFYQTRWVKRRRYHCRTCGKTSC